MFVNNGWIVEAKLNQGELENFKAVMNSQIKRALAEKGTLNYQYYLSDAGDIMVYERFADPDSSHEHIENWDAHAKRWMAAAALTRMLHLGDLPEDVRERHAALSPTWLKPLGGFARENAQGSLIDNNGDTTFENFGWIVEAKLNDGQLANFKAVMNSQIERAKTEEGTLNYQYYMSDEGDILVYERFKDLAASFTHIENWDAHAERWIAAATPTRMVHLGDLPQELREKHAALAPLLLKPFGGFAR
ncbi:putative quinol monooxygenase [Shewanella intestini]|uniref:Antibiotic biosynthesis monooxygenase n=1 Tax=Shewanella intestini TaxID=2017544 RepID=A0ABS5HXX5_9GAMM|nr:MULTISPECIES: antibiotic biosynthesis monooxygenase [Shewanella]MBR9726541.1 antibiotic biosynthesis monooxygenase [Shewanella intestini]MRG34893.1 antibiotic biosynthesis monooxygenase [Shewanella sp. XMDDZSB0408]